jgi:[CysO sulfur-carrier protein]-S-L-cysteine hydrolase
VWVPRDIHDAIVTHAHACRPEEACGLVAADADGVLTMAYCLTNTQHSPTAYTIDPEEHFRALRHAESSGWHLAGVFHSHPHSDPYPSPIDRRLAPDPDWVYLIVGQEGTLRGYRLQGGSVTEVSLEIEA